MEQYAEKMAGKLTDSIMPEIKRADTNRDGKIDARDGGKAAELGTELDIGAVKSHMRDEIEHLLKEHFHTDKSGRFNTEEQERFKIIALPYLRDAKQIAQDLIGHAVRYTKDSNGAVVPDSQSLKGIVSTKSLTDAFTNDVEKTVQRLWVNEVDTTETIIPAAPPGTKPDGKIER